MRIPILRGRNLLPGERGAAIVSESLALSLWPGEDALGKAFDNRTVVGVAGSARQVALQDPDAVEAYFPIEAGDVAVDGRAREGVGTARRCRSCR